MNTLAKYLHVFPKGIVKIIHEYTNHKNPWTLKLDHLRNKKYAMFSTITKKYAMDFCNSSIRLDDFCNLWNEKKHCSNYARFITNWLEFKQISKMYDDFFYEWLFLPSLTGDKNVQIQEFTMICFTSLYYGQKIELGSGLRCMTNLYRLLRHPSTLPVVLKSLSDHVHHLQVLLKCTDIVPPSTFAYPTRALVKILKFYNMTKSVDYEYYRELFKTNSELMSFHCLSSREIATSAKDKAFAHLYKLCGIIENNEFFSETKENKFFK